MRRVLTLALLVLAIAVDAGAQARTMFPTTDLLTGVTSTGAGGPQRPATGRTTVQARGATSAGAGAATIVIEVSNVEAPTADTQWITAGTITLTLGTTEVTDGFAINASWRNIRARVSAISGTNATVSAHLAVGQ